MIRSRRYRDLRILRQYLMHKDESPQKEYLNIETGEIITTNQLKRLFIHEIMENPNELIEWNFDHYLNRCLTCNNGALKPVQNGGGKK